MYNLYKYFSALNNLATRKANQLPPVSFIFKERTLLFVLIYRQ